MAETQKITKTGKKIYSIQSSFEPKEHFISRFPLLNLRDISNLNLSKLHLTKANPNNEPTFLISQLKLLFSEEKAKIIKTIKETNPDSIYSLAKILKRDFKTVRNELRILEEFGIVKLTEGKSKGKIKKGTNRKVLKPTVAIDKLVIDLEI
jgi:predicted transcriptional regulator